MFNESCSQNETCSYRQKLMPVSVPVAVVPVVCIGCAVCAVELCLASALVDLAQCLLPGFTQAVLVVVLVTAVPPVSLPACPV